MWVLSRYNEGRLTPNRCPVGRTICHSEQPKFRCPHLAKKKQQTAYVCCRALSPPPLSEPPDNPGQDQADEHEKEDDNLYSLESEYLRLGPRLRPWITQEEFMERFHVAGSTAVQYFPQAGRITWNELETQYRFTTLAEKDQREPGRDDQTEITWTHLEDRY